MKRLLYILFSAFIVLTFGKKTIDFCDGKLSTSIFRMQPLIYSSLVKENQSEFLAKVKSISDKLGIDPNWLMAIIYIETAGTFSPSITNSIGAVGLIQFTPKNAIYLGTSVEELALMTNVEQLDFVYKHFRPYRAKIKSFVDCYFAVFFPAAIGKASDYVLQTSSLSAGLIARQNSGYDLDRNQQITVLEVETALFARINPEYLAILKKDRNILNYYFDMSEKTISILLAAMLIVYGGLSLYKSINS